jgi:hypothetical protein
VTATCPNGHASQSADYCDQCGIRLGHTSPQIPSEGSLGDPTANPGSGVVACPVCGDQVEGGGRYCETCGTDIENASADQLAGSPPAAALSAPPPMEWELVVACDRDYFDRVEAEEIEFPAAPTEWTVSLAEDRICIGRGGAVQPGEQALDLSAPPADSGVSRHHAVFERQPDGGWTVVDCHSTNGTYLNDGADPISCEQPVPVVDGDRIHLGAWTTMTLRLVPRLSTVRPRQAESSGAGSRRR